MGDDDARKYRCEAMHEIQKLRQELDWVMGQYRALAEIVPEPDADLEAVFDAVAALGYSSD
ncbi:hypothetical protein BGZ82_002317 [Podila clonocystis]|nr:hypothetical protein BGZ82_002317 [Podila clonocystis]